MSHMGASHEVIEIIQGSCLVAHVISKGHVIYSWAFLSYSSKQQPFALGQIIISSAIWDV